MKTATTIASAAAAPAASGQNRLAARSTNDDLRAMPGVLKSEWIKLASVRSTQAIVAVTGVAGALVSWAVATFVTDEVLYVAEAGFYWTVVAAIMAAVAGVLLFTAEVQHGTLAPALAAQPARWVIVASKAIAAAGLGLALGAVSLAAGFGGAFASGIATGDTAPIASGILWALLYTTMSALLGLGVGLIVRHSAAAVTGLLVWGFVLEGLLNLFIPARISRFLPFLAGDRLLAIDSDLDTAESLAVALSRPQAALIFGIYAAVALLIGAGLFQRRDAA